MGKVTQTDCSYEKDKNHIFQERAKLVETFNNEKNAILLQISLMNGCLNTLHEHAKSMDEKYEKDSRVLITFQEEFHNQFAELKGTFEARIAELQAINIKKDFFNAEQDVKLEVITQDLNRIQLELSKRIEEVNTLLGNDFKDEVIRKLIAANESALFDKMEFVRTSIAEIKRISLDIKEFKDHISRIEGIYGTAIETFSKINLEREKLDNLDRADRRSNLVKLIIGICGFLSGILTPEIIKFVMQ